MIFNPLGIGDVLFSTPMIRALKEKYPDASVSYICNRRTHQILKNDPAIERFYIFEKDEYKDCWKVSQRACLKKIFRFFAALKRERFDMVLDLSLGCNYTIMFFLMGIRERVGFNFKNRGTFLTKKLTIDGFRGKHAIEFYLDLARIAGAEARENSIHLIVSEDDTRWAKRFLDEKKITSENTLIGMVPGCGASWGKDAGYRRWDGHNFSLVGDMLASKQGVRILLFGDANEKDLCSPIATAMRHKPLMACGKTSLGQFLALMSECDLVITNDGGPLHIAVGLGVKTVSIFGPVDENIYGPYPKSGDHLVVSNKYLSCRPCYKNFKYTLCDEKKCLATIRPEDVLEGAETLLAGTREKKIRL